MLQNKNGVTEILKKYTTQMDIEQIDEASKRTGMKKEDIISLMQDGLMLPEIIDIADRLPFKEISDSAAIREMIKKDVIPEKLALLQKKQINISSGKLQISELVKIAEVDERGLVKIDETWFEKNLRAFAEMGLIDVSEDMVLQEIDDKSKKSLMVVPLQRKKEEMTKEEIEKEEIARELGEDPDNILRIVRIEDKDAGSKLFNQDIKGESKPILVQLKNYKFNLMREDADGKKSVLQGYEVTPVGQQVSSLLKPTMSSFDDNLKEGDVMAGKTNANQQRYDVFQIRKAGENSLEQPNQLLYVGLNSKTELNVIERKESGDVMFAKTPTSSVYPRSVYIENTRGVSEKSDIEDNVTMEAKEETGQDMALTYKDLGRRRELLERLMAVEEQIISIENEGNLGLYMDGPKQKVEERLGVKDDTEPDISDDLADNSRKLPDLYSQRSELLMQLGMDESELVKGEDELEHLHTNRRLY